MWLVALGAAGWGGCPSAPEPRRGGGSLIEIEYLEPLDPETSTVSHATVFAETADESEPDLDEEKGTEPETEPSAPMPAEAPGAALPGTHPTMRKAAAELVKRLAADGIHVKLIFGWTPYVPRKRMGPGGWANWHEFGLAFDLNLVTRKSLGDAKKHFEDDAHIWRRIGELAAELGLIWGGSWRTTYDPFHFEWHPGHDSVINRDDLRQLLRLAGKRAKNYRRVWSLYPAPVE